MSKADAIKHATDNLQRSEKELKDFDECVVEHHMKVIQKQPGVPECDVTEIGRAHV